VGPKIKTLKKHRNYKKYAKKKFVVAKEGVTYKVIYSGYILCTKI
jgi:hypothetical protein